MNMKCLMTPEVKKILSSELIEYICDLSIEQNGEIFKHQHFEIIPREIDGHSVLKVVRQRNNLRKWYKVKGSLKEVCEIDVVLQGNSICFSTTTN